MNNNQSKAIYEHGKALASIRFTDAARQPLKGVRVTLTPVPAR